MSTELPYPLIAWRFPELPSKAGIDLLKSREPARKCAILFLLSQFRKTDYRTCDAKIAIARCNNHHDAVTRIEEARRAAQGDMPAETCSLFSGSKEIITQITETCDGAIV